MERWAELTADGPRRVVTLEREFRTDPADLWQAITDPERAGRWLASLTVQGDDVTLGFDGGSSRSGKILECDAPRRLRVVLQPDTADQSFLGVTLEATNAGTKLVMQQDGLSPIWAALYAAGWQHHAERLDAAIGGSATETPMPALVPTYREAEAASVAGWVTRTDDGAQVELERVIAAPRAEVWDAMTNPARIGSWWWPVVEWPDDPARVRTLRAGDRFALGDANMPQPQRFEVADLDDERELTLRWAGTDAELVLALSDHPGGTMLRLRQSPTPDRMAGGTLRTSADYGAGWHSIVDALVGYLGGIPLPDGDAMWQAAYVVYAVRDFRMR
ncbi:MAG: SRPBCC domain-containing protein [Pseudolysinimonas sp.]